jgi:outer membrane receptor protein involved in Fe transport
VLNLRTAAPRDSPGGKLRFTFGQLNTAGLSGRWAGQIGDGWYLKVVGGYVHSDDFSRSRNETVEYEGVPLEAIPLSTRHDDISSGSVRADKYFQSGRVLTLEGGAASIAGPVLLTTTGRAQPDAVRTWTRTNFNSPHWNALFYTNTRHSANRPSPASGVPLSVDDQNVRVELQGNHEWRGGSVRLVGGTAFGRDAVDTADDQGIQTLLTRAVVTKTGAVFGQLDVRPTQALKLVVASRWDNSTLHDAQFSPKLAAVYDVRPNQSIRVSYNRAFQVANYAEFFVHVPGGPPLNLSGVEAAVSGLTGGVPLGFGFVPLLVRGNEDLKVEEIRAFEVGYRGVLSKRAFVTADLFVNRLKNFITDALPGVNPRYPAWTAPAVLPAPVRGILESSLNAAVPGLSNDPGTGNPILVYSLGNTGRVDSHGAELGLNWLVHPRLTLDTTYTWFDFDVKEQGFGAQIHPNAPSHQTAGGLTYAYRRLSAAAHYRRVSAFDWASGLFVGRVPSYGTANADATYQLENGWQVALNVTNLLNNVHYEVFGGDLLKRRAVCSLVYAWK